ncbi:Bifunctional protein Aas [Rubripirellula lacrimiformis]|uniref:Bifunctional protein Aas n=1 Tax=Rubripirellula lacrimiformis TaxID=1930273 RepID=A0A517NDQ3_9BACT|nr:AMP-binding protein [Rubripirellula lacrimiformis]QDT05261.1 Bifunctional protein Aas [Rubripirellula lacrimiformis]
MNGWQIALAVLAAVLVALLVMAIVSPRRFVRLPFRILLPILYRKRVIGLDNLPREGGCVVISNHLSWIDGILILWMLPRNVRFVVDGGNFTHPIAKYLGDAFDTIFMTGNPKSIGRALRAGRKALNDGDVVGIFPEGTLSRTGQLQAFKAGVTKILKGTEAPIVPMWMEGMWGSIFSFSGGKFFFKWPKQFRRTLTLYIGEPLPTKTPLEIARTRVQSLGARANIDQRKHYPILAKRMIRVWRRRGSELQAADSLGTEASGRDMLIRTLALRRTLAREVFSKDEQYVGVLLPPSVGGVVVNVALAMDRRISANLNYTVSSDVVNHCIREVGIKHVLTSERFMSKLDLDIDAEVVLLDSLAKKVTKMDKAIAFIQATLVPAWILDHVLGLSKIDGDDLLTIIFTSGSTGMPKGVLLSNANISHNVDAIERAVKLDTSDTVLGVLPFFHSFGYSVTLWAAMALGPRGIYHFNPLDSKQVGKLSEKYGVTVLLATPTFLRGYLRRVKPEQFAKLDAVVVGAEKMPKELFDGFEKQFGVRPVEGYGATELSPLVSVNIPPSRSSAVYQADRVEGSVGRPLPGIATRVLSPETGEEMLAGEDGMLMVTGPNVMKGYANQAEMTGKAIQDGWYVTGDIANVDDQGFIHITGRLSRFSKIGGEMVPHVRIEEELAKLFSEGDDDDQLRCCVTAVPDPKKGERLIVLHLASEKDIDTIRKGLSEAGLPNLFIPSRDGFQEVDAIPMLGTGKLDLKGAKEKAADLTQSPSSTA